jgi:lipopolysaccharide/colanic/teichoic acid biosynthesis glycosyltransferase
VAALAIKLDSPGPVLFRQKRCGLNGRIFDVLKLRSMYIDAENRRAELIELNEMDGPVFKIRNDPRVTRVGRWLRRLSVDELPQLWNVLRGEMSLVGPRPRFRARWTSTMGSAASMRPGITCLVVRPQYGRLTEWATDLATSIGGRRCSTPRSRRARCRGHQGTGRAEHLIRGPATPVRYQL